MQVSDYNAGPWTGTCNVAGRGTPSRAREWACLSRRNELSEETHVLTMQETLLGRGAWVECSRVREPQKTALPCGSQPQCL